MKNVSVKKINLTLITVLGTLSAPMAKAAIFTMDDLKKLERERRIMRIKEVRAAVRNPSFASKSNVDKENEDKNRFVGKGKRLGGNKYANRLLGISEKEGRRLVKEARRAKKAEKKAARKTGYKGSEL